MSRAILPAAALLLWPVAASADGLSTPPVSPRSIARAGAVMVSDDGGAALLVNPAGTVRRGGTRLQLAVVVRDSETRFRAASSDAPSIGDKSAASSSPYLAVLISRGRFVLGASYLETGTLNRAFVAPAAGQPSDEVSQLFPHRYGGLALRYRRRTVAGGVAIRAGDSIGLGISANVSRVQLRETRRVWAGFDGRDAVGDPSRDLQLALDGDDPFVAGLSAGILYAPDLPIELALSGSWAMNAHIPGNANLESPRTSGESPSVTAANSPARATLTSPLILRAGARYLGERIFLEALIRGEFYPVGDEDATWRLDGGVTAEDQTGATGTLLTAPSVIDRQARLGVSGAIDIEVKRGFLWLTAGYGYESAGTRLNALSPGYGALGGHTLAAGAELQWSDMTFTIGLARRLTRHRRVTASAVNLVNPFDAGTAPVGNGRYDRSADTFGAALEVAWP